MLYRFADKADFHGQPEKRPKNEIPSLPTDTLPSSLRITKQGRGWRIQGENC
jgi:hypothetical protein